MRREAGSGKDATSVEVAFELTLKVLEINDATDQSFCRNLRFDFSIWYCTVLIFRLRHDPAAIHVDRLSGHVFGCVAGKEIDGFGDVFRFAGVADRDSLSGGFPFSVGVARSDPRRGNASRRDGIYAYAQCRQLKRQ